MPRGVPNKPAQVPGETAAAPAVDLETKTYGDGTEATGPAPLPDASPAEQAAAAPVSRRAAGLPHPDDIDPKTLKGAVMTTQGWLCPDDSDKQQRR